MSYEEKLEYANQYLLERYGIYWDDLPDTNSLHDCEDEDDIIEACEERFNDII